jgi:serine/threonine-protein kinase
VLPVLEFVHRNGVIHRDIKPDNLIRRTSDYKLVLVDFGAVKQVKMQSIVSTEQFNNETVAIGTPGYMPSEQSQGRPRPSSDLYALGMVGIQALTGLSPSQLAEDPETGEILWRHHAQVGDLLATVLNQMIRHYFKYRYQSATEVLQALQPLIQPYNPKAIAAVVSQMGRYYLNNSYQFGVKALRSLQQMRPITISLTSVQTTKAETAPVAGSVAPEALSAEKTITVAPGHPNPSQIHASPRAETIVISIDREKLLWGLGAGVAAVVAIGLLAIPRQPSPSSSSAAKSAEQQAASKNKAAQQNTCIVVIDPSNVRAAPGGRATGKVVPGGTRVTATGKESDGWLEISAPAAGWIWAERTENTCPKP